MSTQKDLIRVLGELRGGLVATDASQQLEELVRRCQAAGKKGTLTLALTVQPVGSNVAGAQEMHVSAKITTKAPASPDLEERSIFFAQNGQLLRNDPRQPDMYGGPRSADRDDPPLNRFGTTG